MSETLTHRIAIASKNCSSRIVQTGTQIKKAMFINPSKAQRRLKYKFQQSHNLLCGCQFTHVSSTLNSLRTLLI